MRFGRTLPRLSTKVGKPVYTPLVRESLPPDAILVQTAQSGAVSNIQDDPDNPDANWLTGTSATAAELRVSFPTPAGTLVAGTKQEFRVRIRLRP